MRTGNFDRPSKYEELRSMIRDAIDSGEFKPGDLMPSENELSKQYGISRNTIREAIGMLVHEGLLHRIQGRGTFVTEKPVHDQLTIALAVVSEDVSSGFLGPILKAISQETRHIDANTALFIDESDIELEKKSLLDIINKHPDGAIIYYIGEDKNIPYIRKVQDAGIPLVFIDRYPESLDVNFVVTDNFAGAYSSVSELIKHGYRRILHFTHGEEASSIRARREGYKQACLDARLDYSDWIIRVSSSQDFVQIEQAIYHKMTEMLPHIDGPFAVFGAVTHELRGAWRAIQEAGLPSEKVALACFDDPIIHIPESALFVNAMQPLEEMGRKAVQVVAEIAKGDNTLHQIMLEPEIRVTGR